MSEPDDLDLRRAFQDLRAPASTAGYARRAVPPVPHRGGPRLLPALASALVVALALGGAGTVLLLRASRHDRTVTAGAAAPPPGRVGAAMALDSTAGVTVMYGGSGGAGGRLTDTWVWDGSAWRQLSGAGPGALEAPAMADDPPDGGVLLVGTRQPATPPCAVSGSAAATMAPAAVATPAGGGTASSPPCEESSAPSTETWLFTRARGWQRLDTHSATAPPSGAQLAYDSATQGVLAVTSSPALGCVVPFAGAPKPVIACPVEGAAGAPSTSGGGGAAGSPGSGVAQVCTKAGCPGVPCSAQAATRSLPCIGAGGVSTWTWSGGRWLEASGQSPSVPFGGARLVGDGRSPHATLLRVQPNTGLRCRAPCPELATTDVWLWSGTGWRSSGAGSHLQPGPSDANAVAARGRDVVAVTAGGETWVLPEGSTSWQRLPSPSAFARTGEAMADGPGGLVLFGGVVTPVVAPLAPAPGSDTWVLGGTWTRVDGGRPPATAAPCPSPPAGSSCVHILPVPAPAAPAVTPGGTASP